MATLLLLTNAMTPSADVLPALGLLGHTVRVAPLEVSALLGAERGGPQHDAVLVDARRDLAAARSLCRLLRTTGVTAPVFAVLTEGGLVALTAEWGVDDVLLDSAGPSGEAQPGVRHEALGYPPSQNHEATAPPHDGPRGPEEERPWPRCCFSPMR